MVGFCHVGNLLGNQDHHHLHHEDEEDEDGENGVDHGHDHHGGKLKSRSGKAKHHCALLDQTFAGW